MKPEAVLNDLLRCAIQVVGRIAIPPDKVREIVATGKKSIHAYNLCDGTRSQMDIVKKLKLDQGSFSRTQKRWVARIMTTSNPANLESTI